MKMSPVPYVAVVMLLAAIACQMDVGSSATNPNSGATVNTGTTNSPNTNTGATTAVAPAGSTSVAGVRFLGRLPTSPQVLSWPGNGLQFKFTGTQAKITFSNVSGTNFMGLSVDGGSAVRTQVTQGTPVTTPKLAQGEHLVTLRKLNEATYGTMTYGNVTSDGQVGSVSTAARNIEFIGDSITVGYGIEGTSPCSNSASMENTLKTYAALTAAQLNADFSTIAWSGKGVVRNAASIATDTSANMTDIWTRASALDGSGTYTFPAANIPQAVVINLGTNDFTYIAYSSAGEPSEVREPLTQSSFEAGYLAFAQQVRVKYPEATLFLVSSPMLSDSYPVGTTQHTTQLNALKNVAQSLGDKAVVVDFPTQQVGAGLNACDSHPSIAQHQSMATVLTAAIKTTMSW